MNKLLKKYVGMSIEMKAALWYTISNIIQKVAPWLVMIILTHKLSTSEYGEYSVFLSWTELFEIVVTLRIYSSGYVAGLVRDNNDKRVYSATMQTLSYILISMWLIIYCIVHNVINKYTEMSTAITVMMIISFYGIVSFGLWSSRKRVDNRYKSMLLATLFYGVLGPVLGALSVYFDLENPILWVIIIRISVQMIVSIPFALSNCKGAFSFYNCEMARDAIKYNLPLVPYYLSMVLLNHSDRLMIQKYSGYSEAAVYSVAYSASMMIFVVSGALNLSLQAWLFKALKANKKEDQTKLVNTGTIVVTVVSILAIIMAPEIILILGGRKYLSAAIVMPPIIVSVLVMFIYQQYVNVLFYFKKTKYILLCSVLAATFNIILNMFFIPIYGYQAAGYTTFVSYLLVLCIYYYMMRLTFRKNNIEYSYYFDVKMQTVLLTITIILGICAIIFYDKCIIRWCFFGGSCIVLFVFRKRIIKVLRGENR